MRYFTRDEFRYADGVEPCPMLIRMLDDARERAGIPFVINSGIRTPERNAEVGGVPDSAHVRGYAVDISAPTSRARFLITRAVLDAGFKRVGIGRTFVHVDTDPEKADELIWLY